MVGPSRRTSLPRGRSWPVATADVRNALGDLFDSATVVWFEPTSPTDDLLWVRWTPETPRRPSTANENTVAVWIAPANKSDAEAIGDALRDEALPQLAQWILDAFERDDSWQALSHSRRWKLRDGVMVADSHDESPKRLKQRQ
jgi:hypothetical protein